MSNRSNNSLTGDDFARVIQTYLAGLGHELSLNHCRGLISVMGDLIIDHLASKEKARVCVFGAVFLNKARRKASRRPNPQKQGEFVDTPEHYGVATKITGKLRSRLNA